MKIVFCSNFFNHHQLDLSLELYNKKGVEYKFIATEIIPKERIDFGYEDMNKKYPFIIRAYENEEREQEAIRICNDCDVLIIGAAPDKYLKNRLENNKLTFRYSERVLKKGTWRIISPRLLKHLINNHVKYKNKNLYMLCASAYTAFDYSLVGAYKNKCYKWGYFPKCEEFNIEENLNNKLKRSKIEIVWVGRFLNWKHPELLIELSEYLINEKYDFEITMIGNGELYDSIKAHIEKKNLKKYIKLIGAVSYDKVRQYMKESDIFLFTSDRQEGWGAVLNEAMNSGCAVVANNEIGSVPYLIQNNVNGMIYKSKKQLFHEVKELLDNGEKRRKLARNAYYTIIETWNAKNAANNFIKLSSSLLIGNKCNIYKGPCSIDDKNI